MASPEEETVVHAECDHSSSVEIVDLQGEAEKTEPASLTDISLIEGPATTINSAAGGENGGEKKSVFFKYSNPRGSFYTGIDVTSEEALQRKADRMKRFGLQQQDLLSGQEDPKHTIEQREARAKRFGTMLVASGGEPIKLVDSIPDILDAEIRLEALHLHGTDDMSTGDIFAYFKVYSPRNIEWVNDTSCNVVWEDDASAHRALYGLGRQPVGLRSQYDTDYCMTDLEDVRTDQDQANQDQDQKDQDQANQDQDQVNQDQANQDQTNQDQKDQDRVQANPDQMQTDQDKTNQMDQNQMDQDQTNQDQTNQDKTNQDKTNQDKTNQDKTNQDQSLVDQPSKIQVLGRKKLEWRYGKSHPNAKQLLLRFATILDVKQKGAAKVSVYYQKYGKPGKPPESSMVTSKARRREKRGGGGGGGEGGEEGGERGGEMEEVEEQEDLRSRIGRKHAIEEEGVTTNEELEVGGALPSMKDDPFILLAKRPRPLYSDRKDDDILDAMEESEKQRRLTEDSEWVGLGGGETDLRRELQRKKKRRNLKLRIGNCPRSVEEKR